MQELRHLWLMPVKVQYNYLFKIKNQDKRLLKINLQIN